MANPFAERGGSQYPSPIQGIKRGYEAFIADQTRRKADSQNQRQEMMRFMVQRMLENRRRLEAEQQQAWRVTQEKGRMERARGGYPTWEAHRAGQADIDIREHGQALELEGLRQKGRVKLKGIPTPGAQKGPRHIEDMHYDQKIRLMQNPRTSIYQVEEIAKSMNRPPLMPRADAWEMAKGFLEGTIPDETGKTRVHSEAEVVQMLIDLQLYPWNSYFSMLFPKTDLTKIVKGLMKLGEQ